MKPVGVGPAPCALLRDRAAKEPRLGSLPPKSAVAGSEGGPRALVNPTGQRQASQVGVRRGVVLVPLPCGAVGGMEVSLPRARGRCE